MNGLETLSTFETFLWGCAGGGAAYLLVFALPELRNLWNQQIPFPSMGRVIVALLLAAVFITLGGVAAVVIGDAREAKHAIAYGIGFEAILGGVLRRD